MSDATTTSEPVALKEIVEREIDANINLLRARKEELAEMVQQSDGLLKELLRDKHLQLHNQINALSGEMALMEAELGQPAASPVRRGGVKKGRIAWNKGKILGPRSGRSGSQKSRLEEFLKAHADKEFSSTELAEKSGVPAKNIHAGLRTGIQKGYVRKRKAHTGWGGNRWSWTGAGTLHR